MEVEIKDPFEFFNLPFDLQYEYLLLSDLESIKNLCAAARLSNNPKAKRFFTGTCDNDRFWKEKTTLDFGERIPTRSTWRMEYEKQTMELVRHLINAASGGDVKKIKELLKNLLLTVDSRGYAGYTPLMRAAGDGKIDAVDYLLSQGADINARNDFGVTPLMLATVAAELDRENRLRMVQLLVERGADINARNREGRTALFYAFYEDIREYLERLGATL